VVLYHPIITVEKTEGSPLSKLPQIVGPQKWDYITFICPLWEQK